MEFASICKQFTKRNMLLQNEIEPRGLSKENTGVSNKKKIDTKLIKIWNHNKL